MQHVTWSRASSIHPDVRRVEDVFAPVETHTGHWRHLVGTRERHLPSNNGMEGVCRLRYYASLGQMTNITQRQIVVVDNIDKNTSYY